MEAAYFVAVAAAAFSYLVLRKTDERLDEAARVEDASPALTSRTFVPGAPQSAVTFYTLPHMCQLFPHAPTYRSPIVERTWPINHNHQEVSDYTLPSQAIQLTAESTLARSVDASVEACMASPAASPAAGATATSAASGATHALRRIVSTGSMDRSGRGMDEVEVATPSGGHVVLAPAQLCAYATAGPARRIVHNPATVKVAIATCGGLCPGLNTVVREIVMCLTYVYGVPKGNIFGVPNGYRGFYSGDWNVLRPEDISRIHTVGGTVLGSSRGGMDVGKIVDSLIERNVGVVILIGGDGTHRGADVLFQEAMRRGAFISFACVPKTIDNDISIIDRSFGFQTAVEQAVHPITCAHTEAHSAKNGIGLVKLMGREAGFIALYASLASRDVNVCLLPEAPWRLSSLLTYLEDRLARSGHAVIVVAEGAESIEEKERKAAAATASAASGVKKDESGNRVLEDVGEYLKSAITAHFKKNGQGCNLKYIDPSYIIRSSPANAADSDLCAQLAFNCVHGAMAGRTGFTVGTVDNVCVWLPTWAITTAKPRRVDMTSRIYARLCSSTGQPNLELLHPTLESVKG